MKVSLIFYIILTFLGGCLYGENLIFFSDPTDSESTQFNDNLNNFRSNLIIEDNQLLIKFSKLLQTDKLLIISDNSYKIKIPIEFAHCLLNSEFSVDLTNYFPVFFIVNDIISFEKIDFKYSDNKVEIKTGVNVKIYSPSDTLSILRGRKNSSFTTLYFHTPEYISRLNGVVFLDPTRQEYRQGELLGFSEFPSIYFDFYAETGSEKIIPIFITNELE